MKIYGTAVGAPRVTYDSKLRGSALRFFDKLRMNLTRYLLYSPFDTVRPERVEGRVSVYPAP